MAKNVFDEAMQSHFTISHVRPSQKMVSTQSTKSILNRMTVIWIIYASIYFPGKSLLFQVSVNFDQNRYFEFLTKFQADAWATFCLQKNVHHMVALNMITVQIYRCCKLLILWNLYPRGTTNPYILKEKGKRIGLYRTMSETGIVDAKIPVHEVDNNFRIFWRTVLWH